MTVTVKALLLIWFLSLTAACMTAGKGIDDREEISKQNAAESPWRKPKPAVSHDQKMFHEAEAYVEGKRIDNSVYWGEGIANIDDDIGTCKIEARKRAIAALAGQIKTQVSSDFKKVIRTKGTENQGLWSEAVEKSIEQKLETYTSQVLTNLKESRLFIDYPKRGTGTYIVFISKKEYEETVKKDMNQKKQLITATIQSGDRAFLNKRFVEGLKQYIHAREMKQSFFGMIPVWQDIDGDKRTEEMRISIDERIRQFLGGLRLSLLNDTFRYDSEGHPETLPRVYVRYTSTSGVQSSVAGLPLKIVFMKGEGVIAPAVTGDYGEVEIDIARINPKHRETVIRVGFDSEKISGLNKISTGRKQSVAIHLTRKKTVALAVSFVNTNKTSTPNNLRENISAMLLEKKFSVIHLPVTTEQTILKNRNVNADYILQICAKTSGGGAVGQYTHMFTVLCSATLNVYKMPLKSISFTENLKNQQGFGVTMESAGWDGFGKISAQIEQKAKAIIERLK